MIGRYESLTYDWLTVWSYGRPSKSYLWPGPEVMVTAAPPQLFPLQSTAGMLQHRCLSLPPDSSRCCWLPTPLGLTLSSLTFGGSLYLGLGKEAGCYCGATWCNPRSGHYFPSSCIELWPLGKWWPLPGLRHVAQQQSSLLCFSNLSSGDLQKVSAWWVIQGEYDDVGPGRVGSRAKDCSNPKEWVVEFGVPWVGGRPWEPLAEPALSLPGPPSVYLRHPMLSSLGGAGLVDCEAVTWVYYLMTIMTFNHNGQTLLWSWVKDYLPV